MKTRSWEDANGVKRYKTEIIADTLELLGGPHKNAEHDQGDAIDDVQVEPTTKKRSKNVEESIEIEDIPF
jgi:single-strand DNA-binding protein